MTRYKKIIVPALILIATSGLIFLNSCGNVKIPAGVQVVKDFDANLYAGTWYEVARFDFKHEKDLKNVTANYQLNDDGSIKVTNKGFNYVKNEWEEVNGKAKFIGETNVGALKVSFFGPFYGGYNVVMMNPDYENALVFGENTDYIWMLSRNKKLPENVKKEFLEKAQQAGYDLTRLVWTEQD